MRTLRQRIRSNGASPSGGNGSRTRLWRANVTSARSGSPTTSRVAVLIEVPRAQARRDGRAPSARGSGPPRARRARRAEMSVARMRTGGAPGRTPRTPAARGCRPPRRSRRPRSRRARAAPRGPARARAGARQSMASSCSRSRRNDVSLTVTSSISRATSRAPRADRRKAQERRRVRRRRDPLDRAEAGTDAGPAAADAALAETSAATRSSASLIADVRGRERDRAGVADPPGREDELRAALRRAFGMPKTAELASSCAIVSPPARRTAPSPSAPSRPMPVSTTATPRARALAAMLRSSTSADGRCGPARRRSSSTSRAVGAERECGALGRHPDPRPRVRPALGEPHGQRDLVVEPAGEALVKPRAMCWTTRIGIGEAGRDARRAPRRAPAGRRPTRRCRSPSAGAACRAAPRCCRSGRARAGWRSTRTPLSSFTRWRKARASSPPGSRRSSASLQSTSSAPAPSDGERRRRAALDAAREDEDRDRAGRS